jgi:hypothetical protein
MPVVTLINDYSPRWVGDLSKPLTHQFTDFQGVVILGGLTGVNQANMALYMKPHGGGPAVKCLGSWTVDDSTNAIASFHWNAADVARPGLFDFQATVPFSDGNQSFEIMTIEFLVPLSAQV